MTQPPDGALDNNGHASGAYDVLALDTHRRKQMTAPTKLNISRIELCRYALGSIEIIDRHAQADAMLTALGSSLGPAANAYITAYEVAHAFGGQRQLAAERGQTSTMKLYERSLGWVQVIARDVPHFDRAEYSVRPDVAHDVISNARKLVALVTGYPTTERPLPYARQLMDDLSQAIARCQQDTNTAKASLVTQQQLNRTERTTAFEFYRQLPTSTTPDARSNALRLPVAQVRTSNTARALGCRTGRGGSWAAGDSRTLPR